MAHNGYLVVFIVVFLNNIGIPVPGDTILLGGGFLVGKGMLSLWAVVVIGTSACFLGSSGAYWFGLRFGRRFLKKIKWFRGNPGSVEKMDHFFEKYGPKVVFFARFVALLHPVTGLLAGTWKTPLCPFIFYNLAGSAAYTLIYTSAGYFFGQKWEIFKSWIGPVAFYAFLIAAALLILFLFLRHSIRSFFDSFSAKRSKPAVEKKNEAIKMRGIPKNN
jgi:membrane protein DedA with SNARE-associated domain